MTLVGAALLGAGPVSASGAAGSPTGTGSGATTGTTAGPTPAAAPMAITLRHGYGSYLGLGTHRVASGKNLLVVEVCGDPVRRAPGSARKDRQGEVEPGGAGPGDNPRPPRRVPPAA